MKRFLATILVLSLLLAAGLFTATASAEEPYTVTMVMTGEQQEDQDRIMAKVNEILLRDLNMQLDLIILPWGSADEQKRLMLTGSEPVDLMLISQTEAISCVANGQLNDMNELIDKYGTNYKEIIGEANAKAAAIGDFVYGACRIREVGQIPCVGIQKEEYYEYYF